MPGRSTKRSSTPWTRLRSALGPIVLILASLSVVLVHVPQHTQISPIDEYVYIDYVAKVPTQFFVRQGEETGSYARNLLSCTGVAFVGNIAPQFCDQPAGPATEYPYAGLTSADIYTPAYFATTWLMAQPLLFFGVPDLAQAARYTGFFWLVSAALLMYFTLRRLKVSALLATSIGLAVVGSAPVFWSNTYVSSDSPTIFIGALLGYLLVRLPQRSLMSWGLIATAAAATMLKVQNFAAVAVVIFCLLAVAASSAWTARPTRAPTLAFIRDKRVHTAILMGVVPLVLQVAWLAIRSAQSLGSGANQNAGQPLGPKAVLSEVFKFFGTAGNDAVVLPANNFSVTVTAQILGWLMVSGVLGTIALSSGRLITHSISLGTLIVAVTLGPALVIATWILVGIYVPLPARYGLSLMPLMLIPAAVMFGQKRPVAWVTSIACLLSFSVGFAI
jgi:hypothetical protein